MTTDIDGKEGKLSDNQANQKGNGPCNSAKSNSDCLLDLKCCFKEAGKLFKSTHSNCLANRMVLSFPPQLWKGHSRMQYMAIKGHRAVIPHAAESSSVSSANRVPPEAPEVPAHSPPSPSNALQAGQDTPAGLHVHSQGLHLPPFASVVP